ncbi:SapC family protein [Ruegeria lacuscaerulensis]|uniref:SapC family protein n=1 Tax=Ruegeria lacuscaerulensis TaxID=55218 RepID=UPI00147DC623|nr:SapC family protein [Ruegeria lacuscaerulensis]
MAQDGLFPVTHARHGQRYWKRFTSFKFAANRTDCAVVFNEIQIAAAAFPIVFMKSERGMEPRALLSLRTGAPTPFLSQDGQWLAPYVPSSLRCHPFQAERTCTNETDSTCRFQLNVDESSGYVTRNPRDEVFFDANGKLSHELLEVQTFLKAYVAASEATQKLCRTIAKLGLLEPIETHGAVDLPCEAFGITSSRLTKLSQAEKLVLVDSGALQLIHAHQISLSHCEWILRAQQQLTQRAAPEKYTENSDISGFLYAMAKAQNADFLESSGV